MRESCADTGVTMNMFSDYTMTIDGRSVAGSERFNVINPATEAIVASAPDCTFAELDAAAAAAGRAQPAWAATPLEDRKAMIRAFSQAMTANAPDLGKLLTSEQGKPLAMAQGEVAGAAGLLQLQMTIELPEKLVEDSERARIVTRRVPLGVVGAIAPWNFPVSLACFKIGPALLTGNTLVLKPSPFTPLATLKLGEIARDIFPAGVFNVISGGDRLGPWMTAHPGFNKITFTGSTETGRKVMESAAPTLKRVTLELGGNDAAIVMSDVDVSQVAAQIFWGAMRNSGQICLAIKRVYAHRDIYPALKTALVELAQKAKVGDGAAEGTQIGPISNRPQYERVKALLADSKAQGHRILVGESALPAKGYFVAPAIIDNPPDDSRIVQEEQFGPVLPIMVFDNLDDVVARVNATDYGLGGSIWSKDIPAAAKLAERIETGTIVINAGQFMSPFAAFGGHKQSGLGVENGVEGMMEYTNAKTFVEVRVPMPVG
jgi:acyl-CoA reductase-like NAD-dependent aldehyde dehydrogenase